MSSTVYRAFSMRRSGRGGSTEEPPIILPKRLPAFRPRPRPSRDASRRSSWGGRPCPWWPARRAAPRIRGAPRPSTRFLASPCWRAVLSPADSVRADFWAASLGNADVAGRGVGCVRRESHGDDCCSDRARRDQPGRRHSRNVIVRRDPLQLIRDPCVGRQLRRGVHAHLYVRRQQGERRATGIVPGAADPGKVPAAAIVARRQAADREAKDDAKCEDTLFPHMDLPKKNSCRSKSAARAAVPEGHSKLRCWEGAKNPRSALQARLSRATLLQRSTER